MSSSAQLKTRPVSTAKQDPLWTPNSFQCVLSTPGIGPGGSGRLNNTRGGPKNSMSTSWPGVSRKVRWRVSSPYATSHVYAPIDCVMPPASPSATFVLRTKSSSDVCRGHSHTGRRPMP
jgi:hypothetical protein